MMAHQPALGMHVTGLRQVAVFPGTISYTLLLLFIGMLYASPGMLIKPLAAFAPSLFVGGLSLAALVFEKTKNREGAWFVWPHSHLFAALLYTAGLSCFTAIWPRLSIITTLDLAKYFIIYLVIVNVVDRESRLKGVLWTMVIAGLFPSLGALHNYAIGNIDPGERVHWVGVFANSNDLAYSIVLLVPLAIALLGGLNSRQRLFLWAVIAIYTATIYVTFSRGSILGFMVVLLLIGVRHRSGSVRFITFGTIAASLAFIMFFWTREQGFSNLADFTLQQRLTTIRAGLEMFLDRPLLGVGLGGSVAAFPLYAPPNLNFTGSLVIHNTLIQALSELGLFGGLFFVLFVALGLTDARRIVRSADAEAYLPSNFREDTRKRGTPTLFRSFHSRSTEHPSTPAVVDGIANSIWGYIVCGLFGPYLMSWSPFLLIGLVSATMKMRQKCTVDVSTRGR